MPRGGRLRSWQIHEHENGTFSLTHGHRSAYDGLSSRHAALQTLAAVHRPGERVFDVEDDGYQTDITGHLIRRRVIGGRPSQASRGTKQPRVPGERAPQRLQQSWVSAFGARRTASSRHDPGKG